MRLLKGFLIAIIGFFIVITLMSLLMPSRVMTSRTIMIGTTREEVMEQVSNIKNWSNWHPVFNSKSTNAVLSDSVAEWETSGHTNRIEINSTDSSSVRFQLKRQSVNPVENMISISAINDSTDLQVEWSAVTKLRWYPWEKFSGLFIDKITGQSYDDALLGLKNYLENGSPR